MLRIRFRALVAVVVVVALSASPLSAGATGGGGLDVGELRTERRVDPLGIDVAAPRLSWQLSASRRGVEQSAYRIQVASRPELLDAAQPDVWDSRRVDSGASVNVAYGGPGLESRQRYFWTVTVWDDTGAEATGEPAWWEMGLLSADDWHAGWIGAVPKNEVTWGLDRTARTGGTLGFAAFVANLPFTMGIGRSQGVFTDPVTAHPVPYLRRTFDVDKPVASARIYSTALGVYELRLNGAKVGDDVLAPGWTDYSVRTQYQTYDVTDQLRQGDNALGAMLGLGWYAGHAAYAGPHVYGETPALLAQLEITYADGTTQRVVSDESWKVAQGPIRSADLLMGEHHDARLDAEGWDRPGFDDVTWAPVGVAGSATSAGAALVAQTDPPVQVLGELPARERTEPRAGTYIFDLGQNFAGVARLKVSGPAGTTVTLRFGEELNPDGSLYVANLRGAKATDSYTLGGGGEEVWEPRFTFHGFRYVEVTGYPGVPELDAITGVVLGSAIPDAGTFTSSDAELNQLQSNIRWGQRSNFLSVPTDCPQRDERAGWTGDAQIFARTAAFNADVSGFFTKWLRDLNDNQTAGGAYHDVAPHVSGPGAGTSGWGDAGVVVPWQLYQAYGDTAVIDEHWDGMTAWISYLQANSSGLIRPAAGYGDWLNINDHTPLDLIGTAYFASSTRLVARMAEATGRTAEAAQYHQLADDITTAFRAAYVRDEGRIHGDSQTAYVLGLSMDLVPEHLRANAAARLVELIEARGGHLSTGFLGARDLMPVLTEAGYTDVAYGLLNERDFPSWRYMIERGATTMWEHWGSIKPDGSFQDPAMNSFNHYAYGAVGEWLYRYIAGIEIDESRPGYRHSIIQPHPGGGLTSARSTYESDYGTVASGWRIDGDRLLVDVTVPANTTATLHLPARTSVTEAGNELVGSGTEGLRFVSLTDGDAVFEAGSGTYSFVTDGVGIMPGGPSPTDPDPDDPNPDPDPTTDLEPPAEVPHDYVDLGEPSSEQAHRLEASPTSGTNSEAGRTRRYTFQRVPLGFFEFDAAIEPGEPFRIRATETYDGNPGVRDYYVLVDGQRVHARSQPNPSRATILEYEIVVDDPALLTDSTVRIRFQEDELGNNYEPSIADVWSLPVADG